MTKNILIGDGPLFNHCVKKLLSEKQKFLLITSDKNKKNLGINKTFFTSFNFLKKTKRIKFLISVMNGKIISENILSKTENAINFHDGPLPKYGGLYSSTWAILNREKKHGCCWHLMTKKIDSGSIIISKKFKIDKLDNAYSVDLKSLYFGYLMFEKKILKILKKNKNVISKKKNIKLKSYYGMKDILKIPNKGFLNLKQSILKSLIIFRALKVSNEKAKNIFHSKIYTSTGIKKILNFNEIKCKNNINIQDLSRKIEIKNNSFYFKKLNKCYVIELKNQKYKFFYLR